MCWLKTGLLSGKIFGGLAEPIPHSLGDTMIEEYQPDGIYRPCQEPDGFLVQAFILFRGKVNRVVYSEPCFGTNGQYSTAPVWFPKIWAAQRKCRQLNGDTSDPTPEFRVRYDWVYENIASGAGSIGSMPNV